jgi:hypothetical protein
MSAEVRDAVRRLFAAGFSLSDIARTVSLPVFEIAGVVR